MLSWGGVCTDHKPLAATAAASRHITRWIDLCCLQQPPALHLAHAANPQALNPARHTVVTAAEKTSWLIITADGAVECNLTGLLCICAPYPHTIQHPASPPSTHVSSSSAVPSCCTHRETAVPLPAAPTATAAATPPNPAQTPCQPAWCCCLGPLVRQSCCLCCERRAARGAAGCTCACSVSRQPTRGSQAGGL